MDNYDNDLFYTAEELAEMLKQTKEFLDRVYLDIKLSRYGKAQADRAMLEFFTKYDFGSFPNEQTRKKLKSLHTMATKFIKCY